jgi:hypothetical protein
MFQDEVATVQKCVIWVTKTNDHILSTRKVPVTVLLNTFHFVSYAIGSIDHALRQLLHASSLLLWYTQTSCKSGEKWVTRLSMLPIHIFRSIFLHNFFVQLFFHLPATLWKHSVMLYPHLSLCCKKLVP